MALHTWSETVDRAQKEKVVEELGQIFESSGVVVVAHYTGLTVAEMQDLRARARGADASVRVAKNKLAKIALDGLPIEKLGELMTGMTVLTYSEDPVAAAKVAEDFAKDKDKFQILGGAMDGNVLDHAGVTAVSKLPSGPAERRSQTPASVDGASASLIVTWNVAIRSLLLSPSAGNRVISTTRGGTSSVMFTCSRYGASTSPGLPPAARAGAPGSSITGAYET